MTKTAISTENLTRDFGPVKALDDLSLEVPAGMIFGFLGPNASGKTTTIHLLLGLLEPTSGRAAVLGFDTLTQADQGFPDRHQLCLRHAHCGRPDASAGGSASPAGHGPFPARQADAGLRHRYTVLLPEPLLEGCD